MSTLAELPWTIAAAWCLVVVWAAAQTTWYFKLRVAPAPPPPRRRDSAGRRSTAGIPSAALPIGGTPEFLAELGLHDPETTTTPAESVYR